MIQAFILGVATITVYTIYVMVRVFVALIAALFSSANWEDTGNNERAQMRSAELDRHVREGERRWLDERSKDP
jgi:hypothetical protein